MKTVYGHGLPGGEPCWHELEDKEAVEFWAKYLDESLVAREVSEIRIVSIR